MSVADRPEPPPAVEDTAAELAAFHHLKRFLDPNPREIKRLINLHRYVKLVLQRPGEPWTADEQQKVVKWVIQCASGVRPEEQAEFDLVPPLIRAGDRDPDTPFGRRLDAIEDITGWIGAPDPARLGDAGRVAVGNVPSSALGSPPLATDPD